MSTYASTGEKPITWPNITAPMNIRSIPDGVPWGQWRYAENVRAEEKGRGRRREGWRSFGHQTGHPNGDLYDQHNDVSQTISSLHLHVGQSGQAGSRVFAGTSTDVWQNRADGGWRLAGSFEAGGKWRFASNGRLLLAVNGKTVQYMQVGGPDRLAEIPSLADIKVTAANVCWEYAGTFFLADVVIGGVRSQNLIVWGNQNSIEFVPSDDSTASFYYLNPGERILWGAQVGTVFIIATTHGFWRIGIQDGKFVFQNAYYSKERVGCLVSPDAIAVDRGIAYLMASDGIYTVSAFSPEPEWSEWLNDTVPIEFIPSNTTCAIQACCFDVVRGEVWFSSPMLSKTLVLDPRHQSSSLIDHAFTALLSGPIDRSDDISMDWARRGVCSAAGLDALFPAEARDDARQYPDAEETPDPCYALDPPDGSCDGCEQSIELIGASSEDGCLKHVDPDYYARDTRVDGVVTARPYGSRLVSGCLSFSLLNWKRVSRVVLLTIPEATDTPGNVSLRVGVSSGAVEPLAEGCRRVWTFSQKSLVCTTPRDGEQPNARPTTWNFEVEGAYLYFDVRVESCVGAPVLFTNFTIHVSGSPNSTP